MNFSSNEIILEAQRGRQWSPLITQQLRLRHLNQVVCFNLKSEDARTGNFYFTLHLTSMSAPFFTSARSNGPHPKWQDLTLNKCPSASAIVLRVWHNHKDGSGDDVILLTWGLHFSGMVYIGNKVTDLQPSLFNFNTVIFYMFGGYFTSTNSIKDDIQTFPPTFMEHSNMIDFPRNKSLFKCTTSICLRSELKKSYSVEKLRKLHYLEVMIKNKSTDVQHIQDKISQLDVLMQKPEINDIPTSPTKNASQLLTMNCLNRMLQEKPTRIQKQEMFKVNKKLEVAKFRSKLLSQELEKKLFKVRQLRKTHSNLLENNFEKESALMEYHHSLHKEKEKLKEYQRIVLQHREFLVHTNSQLQHRKRQLLQQLLWIYPISQQSDARYVINGMFLPNADILSDSNDDGISVALGCVTHILTMCSMFLQVPLRYPVTHYGSRSTITDQISANLPEREFPLFTKGKDRMQFTYGVYLLNKNIAQMRWLYFMHTPDLKLTLPNLLNFLQGYKEFKQERFMLLKNSSNSLFGFSDNVSSDEKSSILHGPLTRLPDLAPFGQSSDPILDSLRQEKHVVKPVIANPGLKKGSADNSANGNSGHACSGLSEILAIPEAFLSRQMSKDSFKNYMSLSDHTCVHGENGKFDSTREKMGATISSCSQPICDIPISTNSKIRKEYKLTHGESVEEGTDLLNPKSTLNDLVIDSSDQKFEKSEVMSDDIVEKLPMEESDRELERSVDSSSEKFISSEQQEFMQNWLRTGPALVCSDKSLYPDEFLGATTSVQNTESPLTARTDALLTTKSFNLVKPKH